MANIAKYQPANSTKLFFGGLFDDLLNHSLSNFIGSDSVSQQPGVNILETPAEFRLEVAAPGFDKQNFQVNVEDNHLIISANRETNAEQRTERFMRREFQYTSFKRSFNLPDNVNQEAVAAVYQNGVLYVTLPKKSEEKPAVKTIQIG